MKLDKNIPFISGASEYTACRELMHKLPSPECISTPRTVVIEHEGKYHLIKARGGICEKPYDMEFNEYTLEEVRQECNPATVYALPEGFKRQNVLIKYGNKQI